MQTSSGSFLRDFKYKMLSSQQELLTTNNYTGSTLLCSRVGNYIRQKLSSRQSSLRVSTAFFKS